MDEARELIGEFVRTLQAARPRHPLEWQGEGGWRPNVAAANCYRGKGEVRLVLFVAFFRRIDISLSCLFSAFFSSFLPMQSVGFHSDVLQYLGPQATIASLTLGVARPFRLRPFIPSSPSTSIAAPTVPLRTLEIVLPHNSLLIMHGGVQETFKHCVPPLNAMDVFRLSKGSLVEGHGLTEEERQRLSEKKWNERINVC
jgi:hypothetical protein